MTGSSCRIALSLLLAVSLIAPRGWAQNPAPQQQTQQPVNAGPPQNPPPAAPQAAPAPAADQSHDLRTKLDYSKGKRILPNFLAPYFPVKVDLPVLTNSPRVEQLIQNGKLMLSLEDAISLALENNLDIRVQRFTPWIAQTDVLRTKAGGAARGLGGTGTASVLGAIPSTTFDPFFTSGVNWSSNDLPVNNGLLSGTGASTTFGEVRTHIANYNFGVSQGFHTGTAISAAWDNARQSTTSTFNFFNPSVQSTLIFSVQQQLLNGFGILPNTRFIIEAKNTLKVANSQFAQQVIATVSQVQNFYWELVFATRNVQVQEAALATSQKLYEDNKKQLEIGTMAPLDVLTAESELATNQQNLIVAQTTQLQQQTQLLNAITKNPTDRSLAGVEIVPTTAISAPSLDIDSIVLDDAVKEAWAKRPEILQAQLNLKNAGVEVKATRNALLPTLTLFGQFSTTGLGGNSTVRTPTTTLVPITSEPIVMSNGTATGEFVGTPVFTTTAVPGGLSDALGQITSNRFPSFAVGLNLTLPIRNRSAQADSARALLDERQLETSYRQLENTIFVGVRNALIALQQDKARVAAAEKAGDLARQTLDAEEKKYRLGASTSYQVILRSRDLTTAQGNEIRAKADMAEAVVNFNQAVGRTLDVNRVTVAEALRGRVYQTPEIPGAPEPSDVRSGNK